MTRWFRVYDELVDDPKVQRLSAEAFKALINLWCLASKNDGILPPADEMAFKLRMPQPRLAKLFAELVRAGLIVHDEMGVHPHNWNSRQYKSDDVTARVKKHRLKRKGNVSCNVPSDVTETPPEADTETDTEYAALAREPSVRLRTAIASVWTELGGGFCPDTNRAVVWLAKGYDPEIIIAVIREVLARKPTVSTLSYFDGALHDAHTNPSRSRDHARRPPPEPRKPSLVDVAKRRLAELEQREAEDLAVDGLEGGTGNLRLIS